MPALKFGFLNTQHLTDSTDKKAAISQFYIESRWAFLALCEAMNSAGETAERAIPTFGRETHHPDLLDWRSRMVATALAHNEFAASLDIAVYPSYLDARYATHEADAQLHYGMVARKASGLTCTLDADLLGSRATPSIRCPLRVDVPELLTVLVWHPPSGKHAFARMLQYEVLTRITARASGAPWVLVGDLNCSPTEMHGNDCVRASYEPAICTRGGPHTFYTSAGYVHCPGVATRRTGTLDFAVSSHPGTTAHAPFGLDVAASFGFDHIPIEVNFPFP